MLNKIDVFKLISMIFHKSTKINFFDEIKVNWNNKGYPSFTYKSLSKHVVVGSVVEWFFDEIKVNWNNKGYPSFTYKSLSKHVVVGSVVEWLTHRTDDQHGLGSKPTCAILLCSWERHFTALSPAWWS